MSRSPTVSTVRGTKREMQQRQAALRAQFGEHGVGFEPLAKERRGSWRLRFWMTPEREAIRLQNLALKGKSWEPELPDSQRAILAEMVGGATLVRRFFKGGKWFWQLSTKGPAETIEDVLLLLHSKLLRQAAGDECVLTPAGRRLVLRRLGGAS